MQVIWLLLQSLLSSYTISRVTKCRTCQMKHETTQHSYDLQTGMLLYRLDCYNYSWTKNGNHYCCFRHVVCLIQY